METTDPRVPTGNSLIFSQLHPATDSGRQVRVYLEHGAREGRLSYGRNPAYTRHEWFNWYLIIPSTIPQFTEAALSLEWAPSTTRVEFLD